MQTFLTRSTDDRGRSYRDQRESFLETEPAGTDLNRPFPSLLYPGKCNGSRQAQMFVPQHGSIMLNCQDHTAARRDNLFEVGPSGSDLPRLLPGSLSGLPAN